MKLKIVHMPDGRIERVVAQRPGSPPMGVALEAGQLSTEIEMPELADKRPEEVAKRIGDLTRNYRIESGTLVRLGEARAQ